MHCLSIMKAVGLTALAVSQMTPVFALPVATLGDAAAQNEQQLAKRKLKHLDSWTSWNWDGCDWCSVTNEKPGYETLSQTIPDELEAYRKYPHVAPSGFFKSRREESGPELVNKRAPQWRFPSRDKVALLISDALVAAGDLEETEPVDDVASDDTQSLLTKKSPM